MNPLTYLISAAVALGAWHYAVEPQLTAAQARIAQVAQVLGR